MAAVAVVTTANPAWSQDKRQPDVLAVKVRGSGAGSFDFDVTISSPYDTPQRYADAFRAAGKDGRVFGECVLLQDHADEQPLTRDLYGVTITPEVRVIVIRARDQNLDMEAGWSRWLCQDVQCIRQMASVTFL